MAQSFNLNGYFGHYFVNDGFFRAGANKDTEIEYAVKLMNNPEYPDLLLRRVNGAWVNSDYDLRILPFIQMLQAEIDNREGR